MTRTHCLEEPVCLPARKAVWPPAIKLIVAFVVGLLMLSPAILGLYWEIILGR